MASISATFGRDARVLGLIGTGHMMSHFYFYTLPPLFPFIGKEYGLGYTELGLLVSVFAGTAAAAQMPVGLLVDRIGARAILFFGLVIEALAIGGMAFTGSYSALLVLAVIGGLGHSVFHPADYAILLSSVDEARMGRAFSIHTVTGNAGTAAAPAVMVIVSGYWSWQVALIGAAAFGVAVAIAIASQAHVLRDHVAPEKKGGGGGAAVAAAGAGSLRDRLQLMLSPSAMVLFCFFLVTTMATNGIQTFSIAALGEIHGTPYAVAAAALSGFLIAMACGVLVGGWIVDHTPRHNLVASLAFAASAAGLVLVGEMKLDLFALVAVFSAMGVLRGMVNPARDMMVKAIMPPGTAGTLFAFMSTGRLLGGTVTPVLLGWMIDSGGKDKVFWVLAAASLVALGTLYMPRKQIRA